MNRPSLALVITLILFTASAFAKDFGVHGETYTIAENDMIDDIQGKLKAMESTGELAEHQANIQKQALQQVMEPKALNHLKRASKTIEWSYDPSFVAPSDIKDANGNIMYKKGYRINPLEYFTMHETLVFIDGRDLEQLDWAMKIISDQCQNDIKVKPDNIKIILTGGSPIRLADKFGRHLYFDQSASLTDKFNISALPAIVWQEGMALKVKQLGSL